MSLLRMQGFRGRVGIVFGRWMVSIQRTLPTYPILFVFALWVKISREVEEHVLTVTGCRHQRPTGKTNPQHRRRQPHGHTIHMEAGGPLLPETA
jgi:hypothetical protein